MMRSFFRTCSAYALGAACAAGAVQAQDFRAASRLPTAAHPAYAAPQASPANLRSLIAPSEHGPSVPPGELVTPADAPLGAMPPESIHGGYGYYGDQAPGAGYGGDSGITYDAPPLTDGHGSIVYGDGYDCGAHHGMGRGWLSRLGGLHCGPTCWFGGVKGLIMDLDNGDDVGFSFDDTAFEPQLLRTDQFDMDWSGGVEASIGRYFHCGETALEVTYWGIYPGSERGELFAADLVGNLGHTFTFNSLSLDAGGGVTAVNDWFQPAQAHRLTRDWNFHNVEVNVLTFRNAFNGGCGVNGLGCGPGRTQLPFLGCWDPCRPRFNVGFLAGFRYLRFDESLQFASDNGDGVFDGGLDEMYYDIDVDNNLYGLQLGAEGELFVTRRISLLGNTKFGVYENHIEQRQRVGNAAGAAFVNDPASPNFGLEYDIDSDEDTVAFLGELDLGAAFYATNNLRLTAGYRVVAASGVARADEQMPYNFDDILGANDANDRGTMILHGAYGGVEFNY